MALARLLTPMQQEMGWSQAWMTGAFSVAMLVSGVVAVPVGRWLDRHGARGLMTLGSCLGSGRRDRLGTGADAGWFLSAVGSDWGDHGDGAV